MHLNRIYCVFCLNLIIWNLIYGQYARIGVVNRKWMRLLNIKLIERKWNNKCQLYEIITVANNSFYTSIVKVNEQIERQKLNVIIGDSRLDVAQAAAYRNIPFIAFDTKLHVSSRPEYANMPNYYALPVSENVYASATFDVLHLFRVTNVAIIIDDTVDYKNFIQPFFETKSIFTKVWTIPSNKYSKNPEKDIEDILKDIRKRSVKDIILKTNKINLGYTMKKARYFGMLSLPRKWFLPNFVCDNFEISSLKHIFTNITFINEECTERYLRTDKNFFEISLINQFFQIIRSVQWNFAPTVLTQKLKGNSGYLFSFDNEGIRNQYTFVFHTISRVPGSILLNVGSWQKKPGRERVFSLKFEDITSKSQDMPSHMRIVAVEEHPHLIVFANNTYKGFGVDLITSMSKMLNFSFSIILVDTYGEKENGTWTGLVGELIYGRADLSLGPVVQTREREEIMDFSTTFKQREISLVMKKPTSSPNYFQFLGPFSGYIWLLVGSSVIVLTMVLWVIEYFHDKHFPEEDRIKFNLKESSWFILASTLQGGTENVPFSIPGRILTGTLYFFAIIIVTSYTANLAAFLTVKAYSNPIKSVDDLVTLPPDSNIKFGTVENSAIHDFFKHSQISLYKKIYKIMTIVNQNWLVNSSSHGYLKAMKENYVFIWDDSINQYEINTESAYKCSLYIVGLPFGKRSFAAGMPQGASYKEKINKAMLNLLESGTIENLEHTWWKTTSICASGDGSSEISSNSLTITELAGVFLVLMCGAGVSIIALIFKIIILRCKPFQSLRNCCQQFFYHLPPDTEPPLAPMSPRSTINRTNTTGTITDRNISPIDNDPLSLTSTYSGLPQSDDTN